MRRGFATIFAAVTDGKVEIEKAISKRGVDTAYKTAINVVVDVMDDEMKDFEFTILVDKRQ